MKTYSFAPINNTTFHYQIEGAGPALVLIHAGIADMRMWDGQMAAFARRFSVIRYDVRGWGQTPFPAGEASDVADLAALLVYLGHEKAHVVGCSNGGRIALDFALAYPERVDRLVLVGAALGGYEFTDSETVALEEAMEQAYEAGEISRALELDARLWIDGLYRRPDQVAPAVRRRAVELLAEVYALPEGEGTRLPLDPPALGRLGEIQSPALVLTGELDTPDILRIASLLAKRLPDVRTATFPGAAHLPNMEQSETFNHVVLDFLGGS